MGDGTDEILERLAALEAQHQGQTADRGPGPPPPPTEGEELGPPGLGAGFDEKRVVDLIVGLVVQQVDQILERRLANARIDEERLTKAISREVDRQLGETADRLTAKLVGLGMGKGDPEKSGKKKKKKRKDTD